jgi:metal-dependent amidase/aminoacylase/carboxypeptidase family protein
VIPDYTAGRFNCRSLKSDGLEKIRLRVDKIFRSAADATGCEVKVTWDEWPYLDVVNNTALMDLYTKAMNEAGYSDLNPGVKHPDAHTGSTDFGSVSQHIPSIHPMFGIHTEHNPHTAGFAEAAGQDIAFDDALVTAKALVATGLTVLEDEQVYANIVKEFQQLKQ